MAKKLMLGNEAIARGAYEAGIRVLSAYPGTPSTEVAENMAKYTDVYAEWAPNEKVAFEVAVGASFAGARSMVCMKHVGVNVAADPMFTAAYTGVNGGLVILAADDPGMFSSQNEQDTRFYARSAHIPLLEPSDSAEAKDFVKKAFELSEKYDTPVFVRTTTRLAHSQSFVEEEDRVELPLKPYPKDIKKYTLMPASAIGRHLVVEDRENRLKADVNNCPLNVEEINGTDIGVICSGVVYQYVKEALPNASVLKLGIVYPLCIDKIKEFAKKVKRLIVVEELEPFIENQLKANGIPCDGKNLFSIQGELSVAIIKEKVLGEKLNLVKDDLPVRPPVMCAGCPHRGVFYILSKLKLTVSADIGCYTLGAQAPLSAVDTVLCMGASVGIAHGFEKAVGREQSKHTVAVIGDSTFIHSGITGLINAVYNQSNITLIILDNSTTGMTGHQQHPATGLTLQQKPAPILNIVELCKTIGVQSVQVVDSYDLAAVEKAVKEETARDGVSVIVAKRACALLNRNYPPALHIEDCRKCGMCLKIGCPAIEKQKDGSARINPSQCVGCGLCKQLCKFDAIKG
ncbi:MAG: indolepyruvate ferredoxin oxidoreductase subunit alpha [Clostridia bacterium]|nr:indolepyruvate ferredoxin oxidoreductase subunit alpha [Clostridia bacterium]